MRILEVIRRPLVTEKSTTLQELGKYVFEVATTATKTQIKEAIEEAFEVEVVAVNTINMVGKIKRYGPRPVQKKAWKKAIVTLKKGDKIEVFEGA